MTKLFTSIFLLVVLTSPVVVYAETTAPEFVSQGTVIDVQTRTDDSYGFERLVNDVSVEILENDEIKIVVIEIGDTNVDQLGYRVGDQVLVNKIVSQDLYYISGFARQTPMAILAVIFAALTVLVARKKGFFSLVGLCISFGVIFGFILPNIVQGGEPLLTSIIGAVAIALINFYLSHGFRKQTSIAVLSTVITLIITAVLAVIFVEATRLTGFSSDEALFLTASSSGQISIREVLLAGIIIGVVGILDDITVSQTSVVYQLRAANKKMGFSELIKSSTEVGRDHIASLVNTLILVYTSAALPLLLLISQGQADFFLTINNEIFAEEIVRTLVTSIGLVAAVPIATYLSAYFAVREEDIDKVKTIHSHEH